MKKNLKISLWIGLIGVVLCIIGIVGGANVSLDKFKSKVFDRSKEQIQETIIGDDITDLKIYISNGKIQVIEGAEFKIEGTTSKNRGILIKEKHGTLTIGEKNEFIYDFPNIKDRNIKIYIPKDYVFNNVDIEIGAGEFVLDNINVNNNFQFDIGAGHATLNKIICQNANLECGAGQIDGSLKVKKNLELECGMGDVKLEMLEKKESYNYELDVGIGNLNVGDISISGIGDKKVKNTKQNRSIKAECGMGNVNISFKEGVDNNESEKII